MRDVRGVKALYRDAMLDARCSKVKYRASRFSMAHLRKKQSLRSAFPPATTAGRCLHPIFLFKPINPSACIDKPLYPGIEGMAFRTNFHFNVFSCTCCLDDFPASTCHRGLFVFRVNFFFHVFTFFPIWIKALFCRTCSSNISFPVNSYYSSITILNWSRSHF